MTSGFFISKSDSEDGAQSKICFIRCVGRLRERGDSHEPLIPAIGNVRADKNVSAILGVPPIGENELVQEFQSNRQLRTDFIACTECLRKFVRSCRLDWNS